MARLRSHVITTALVVWTASASAAELPIGPETDVVAGPRLPRARAPRRLVTGQVLAKIAGLDTALMRRADHGDMEARRQIDVVVAPFAARAPSMRYVRRLPVGFALFTVAATSEEETEAVALGLRDAPGVVATSINRWYRALRVPDDALVEQMWHLDSIRAFAAWDVTTGAGPQRIAVVDTGTLRGHEDLEGKDAGGFDFVSDDLFSNDGDARDADYEDAGDGGDLCGFENTPDSFHGSHVAGTILANADNGRGIAGIDWQAELITVRALGICGGSAVDIFEGVSWLAGEDIDGVPPLPFADRPRIANLSLGAPEPCDTFTQDVLARAAAQGLIAVVAAGNDAASVNAPANCNAAIAVAAHAKGGDRPLAGYSSFGDEVAIVAPGGEQSTTLEDGVLSLSAAAGSAEPYVFYQGTSMATPHVVGVVSLLLGIQPLLTRDDVVDLLQETGDACRGCGSKVALRADRSVATLADRVGREPAEPCAGACAATELCIEGVCRSSCTSDDDCVEGQLCDVVLAFCVRDDVNVSVPGGGGGGGGDGTCELLRGHADCERGENCRPDGSGGGQCVRGLRNGEPDGALCEVNAGCESGLCDRGVCTVPCDAASTGCKSGFTCDVDAAPGGLCRADDCDGKPEGFCASGDVCVVSQEHHVCADAALLPLRCDHSRVDDRSPPASLALFCVAWLLLRTRRS